MSMSLTPPRLLPACLQSQASSSELGKQLAEVESLLQKQDLLEAQISAHGETISTISSRVLKVLTPCSLAILSLLLLNSAFLYWRKRSEDFLFDLSTNLCLCQVKVRDGQQIQSRVRALDSQYKSLVSLSNSRLASVLFWSITRTHATVSLLYTFTCSLPPLCFRCW